MKCSVAALLIAASLSLSPARAQADAEDFRRLNGTVENLNEGQESLRRQVNELREQMSQLRAENAQLKQALAGDRDTVTRTQLNQVVEQLREVDRKRAADAEYVKTQLGEIARDVNKSLAAPKESSRPRPSTKSAEPKPNEPKSGGDASTTAKVPDTYYEHVVQTGETLGVIIAEYNKANGLKVKTADVLAANPTLKDPKRLKVGQKLKIPDIK
jgi:nucleoid-associated protein YgaU